MFVLVVACSGGDANITVDTPGADEPVAAAAAVTPVDTTIVPETTTTGGPSVDARELLEGALAELQSGYGMEASVVVNGVEATALAGRWMSGSAEFTIESGDGSVDYLIVPDGQYARPTDGEWEELESGAVTDPVAQLASPTAVTVVAETDIATTLLATYPAETFGSAGEPVTVTLEVEDGWLAKAHYSIGEGNNLAETTTTFTELTDITPVTAP